MHVKYDNMHRIKMFSALVFINNDVKISISCMLSKKCIELISLRTTPWATISPPPSLSLLGVHFGFLSFPSPMLSFYFFYFFNFSLALIHELPPLLREQFGLHHQPLSLSLPQLTLHVLMIFISLSSSKEGVGACTQHPISNFVTYDYPFPVFCVFALFVASMWTPQPHVEATQVPK